MTIFRTFSGSVAAAIAWAALSISAQTAFANGLVRYVGLNGNNNNDCQLNTPCRSLRRGIQMTPDGGELRVLESGNYGSTATITRAITIAGARPDVTLSQMFLTIDAANTSVSLRNLQFLGDSSVPIAIDVTSVGKMHIENCVVSSYTDRAVRVALPSVFGSLAVVGSIFKNNGYGLEVTIASSYVGVTIEQSRFNGNTIGVTIVGGRLAVNRSNFSLNTTGISLVGANASIDSTMLFRSTNGMVVDSGSTAMITNSTFARGTSGVSNQGTLYTRQNNTFFGNTSDISGTGAVNNLLPQ